MEYMGKNLSLVFLAALITAAAGQLIACAAFAEEKAKPHAAQQEKGKSDSDKPQAAKPDDKDNGTAISGGAYSDDPELDQAGGEGEGSQD